MPSPHPARPFTATLGTCHGWRRHGEVARARAGVLVRALRRSFRSQRSRSLKRDGWVDVSHWTTPFGLGDVVVAGARRFETLKFTHPWEDMLRNSSPSGTRGAGFVGHGWLHDAVFGGCRINAHRFRGASVHCSFSISSRKSQAFLSKHFSP